MIGPGGKKVGRMRSVGATPSEFNGPNRCMVIVSPGLQRVPEMKGFSDQVKIDGGFADVPASGTGMPPSNPRLRDTVGAPGNMMPPPRLVVTEINAAKENARVVSLAGIVRQLGQRECAHSTARDETRRTPGLEALSMSDFSETNEESQPL
jgi:hypothetical protein